MTFQEFDSYLDKCKICNKELTLLAEFDILTSSSIENGQFEFQVAGTVIFFHDGNGKFKKELATDNMSKGVAGRVSEKMIGSFTIGKRQYPNLGKRKIIDTLSPISLDAIPMTLTKECLSSKDHIYGYRTDIINEFDNNNPTATDVNNEFLQIHNYHILNGLEDKKLAYTKIIEFDKALGLQGDTLLLPYIPVDNWNIDDRASFIKQIEKFSMLL